MTSAKSIACIALFFAAAGFSAPAIADQDNAVANSAAQTLAAAQAGGQPAAVATPVAAPVTPAPEVVRCFSRSGGVETEIVCPSPMKNVSAQ